MLYLIWIYLIILILKVENSFVLTWDVLYWAVKSYWYREFLISAWLWEARQRWSSEI